MLQPEDVATAVALPASDLASPITGPNLPMDGGYRAATPWAGYGGTRPLMAI